MLPSNPRIVVRYFVAASALVLTACGGGGPAKAPTGGNEDESPSALPETATPETEEVASGGDTAAEDAEEASTNESDSTNEFKTVDTHTAKDTHGVQESKLKPTRTEALLKFVVVDKDKGPIQGIVISLVGDDGKKFYTKETDAVGYAEVLVPVGQKYDIVYVSLGRKDIAAKTSVEDKANLTMKLTLRYKRIEPPPSSTGSGRANVVLDGIEFDTGKATIRPGSFARLDGVVEYMAHKPDVRVQIAGHTDNVGNKNNNKALSEKRAQACRSYLIKKGIDASRLEAVGYGDEQPIASNDTPEGRQRNRRIEATEL